MKTDSKILLANVGRNITLAAVLFIVPLMFSPGLYNSFRLPKHLVFIVATLLALFFTIMYFLEKKSIDWKRYKFLLIFSAGFLILQILIWATSASREISFWGSYLRDEGLLVWIFIILFFILLIFNDWNSEKIKSFAFTLIIAATLVACYGVLQKFKLIPNIWASDVSKRIISTMGNPLNLSAYLILTFPFFYYVFIHYKNLLVRIITAIGFFITLGGLYFSQSRSSWIAFLFANFILITFYLFKNNKKIFIGFLILGLLAAAGFTYVGFTSFDKFNNQTLKRMFSVFDPNDLSNKQRFLYWQGSWEAFKDRPIFGWGQDSLQYAFDKNYPPALTDLPETHIDRAHNWHLDMLVMDGAAGWLAMIFILIFGAFKAFKLIKNEDKIKSSIGLVYIYLLFACLLQFFFMFVLISPYLIMAFALALVFWASSEPSEQHFIFKSNLLEKLKKNSNLYLGIGIVLTAFVFLVVFKPAVANRDVWEALVKQKDVYEHINRAAEIMPSQFYRQQFGTLYLKYANEGRINNNEEQMIRDGKNAADIFEQLVKKYPYHYANYLYLAESYDLEKLYNLTDSTFQLAIENFPARHDIYWKWAGFLSVRGLNDEAIDIMTRAIDMNPDVALNYYKLSNLYGQIGNAEKQKEYRDLALEKGMLEMFLTKADKQALEIEKNATNNLSSAEEQTQ